MVRRGARRGCGTMSQVLLMDNSVADKGQLVYSDELKTARFDT